MMDALRMEKKFTVRTYIAHAISFKMAAQEWRAEIFECFESSGLILPAFLQIKRPKG